MTITYPSFSSDLSFWSGLTQCKHIFTLDPVGGNALSHWSCLVLLSGLNHSFKMMPLAVLASVLDVSMLLLHSNKRICQCKQLRTTSNC